MTTKNPDFLSRATGVLFGQVAGDSLGSLVEFRSPDSILAQYPEGLRDLAYGGTFDTIPGQPTDDSEMALLLARSIVERGSYDAAAVRARYEYWLASGPFDCGTTIAGALRGRPNPDSQANGALMRVSPIGIAGAFLPPETVVAWAEQDAGLTHPNAVCRQVNGLFAEGIALAIRESLSAVEVYDRIAARTEARKVDPSILSAIRAARVGAPADFGRQMGWVLIAFQNALHQLLHAPSLEEGVVDTVMRGGDSDTNAAIAGALLGSVYGVEGIPERWQKAILECRPERGRPNVRKPRPEVFWPVDIPELAGALVAAGRTAADVSGLNVGE